MYPVKSLRRPPDVTPGPDETFLWSTYKQFASQLEPASPGDGVMTLDLMLDWHDAFDRVPADAKTAISDRASERSIREEGLSELILADVCRGSSSAIGTLAHSGQMSPRAIEQVTTTAGSGSRDTAAAIACYINGIFNSTNETAIDVPSRVHSFVQDVKFLSSGQYSFVFMASVAGVGREPAKTLVVIKCILDPYSVDKLDAIHETLIGLGVANEMRRFVPNFIYTYTFFRCLPPSINKRKKTVDLWCAAAEEQQNVTYTVIENLATSGTSVDLYAYTAREPGTNYKFTHMDHLAILAQIACATAIAWARFRWTHYDLHEGNVMLTALPDAAKQLADSDGYVQIPYRIPGVRDAVYVRTRLVGIIIDFGFAYAEVATETHDTVSFGKASGDMQRDAVLSMHPNPRHDIFKLFSYVTNLMYSNLFKDDKVGDAYLHLVAPFCAGASESERLAEAKRIVLSREAKKQAFFHPTVTNDAFPLGPILGGIAATAAELSNLRVPNLGGDLRSILTIATPFAGVGVWDVGGGGGGGVDQRAVARMIASPAAPETYIDLADRAALIFKFSGGSRMEIDRLFTSFDFAAAEALDSRALAATMRLMRSHSPGASFVDAEKGRASFTAAFESARAELRLLGSVARSYNRLRAFAIVSHMLHDSVPSASLSERADFRRDAAPILANMHQRAVENISAVSRLKRARNPSKQWEKFIEDNPEALSISKTIKTVVGTLERAHPLSDRAIQIMHTLRTAAPRTTTATTVRSPLLPSPSQLPSPTPPPRRRRRVAAAGRRRGKKNHDGVV